MLRVRWLWGARGCSPGLQRGVGLHGERRLWGPRGCGVGLHCGAGLRGEQYGPPGMQVTRTAAGLAVGGIRILGAPLVAATVMFRAGSRYEAASDHVGVTHFLRSASDGQGGGYTDFSKMRLLQQFGAALTAVGDRETLAFTLKCPSYAYPEMRGYLIDMASRCQYNQYELDDKKEFVRRELEHLHPAARALDLVQTAFWAGPLAASVYCPPARARSMTQSACLDFIGLNFRPQSCAVATCGLGYEESLRLADCLDFTSLCIEPGGGGCASRPRRGCAAHDLGAGSETHVALAVPGAGTADLTSLVCHAVLAEACGADAVCGAASPLGRQLQPPLGARCFDVYTAMTGFSVAYEEQGVFGVLTKSPACTAQEVACQAIDFLQNITKHIQKPQVEVGKNRLKIRLAMHAEDPAKMAENVALQLLSHSQVDDVQQFADLIDATPAECVLATAANVQSSCDKMAIAVVGDTGAVDPTILECN